jgi:hypothetical protein
MAYDDRRIFLIEVASELTAEHVGRLLFMVDLFRRDPDYVEHRGRRVRLVMLVREATAAVIDFARRRKIRVVVVGGDGDQERATAPAGTIQSPLMNR